MLELCSGDSLLDDGEISGLSNAEIPVSEKKSCVELLRKLKKCQCPIENLKITPCTIFFNPYTWSVKLKYVKYVFDDLSNGTHLRSCLHGKNINANEMSNVTIWERIQKTRFVKYIHVRWLIIMQHPISILGT